MRRERFHICLLGIAVVLLGSAMGWTVWRGKVLEDRDLNTFEASEFQLVMHLLSWGENCTVVEIDGDGKCAFTFAGYVPPIDAGPSTYDRMLWYEGMLRSIAARRPASTPGKVRHVFRAEFTVDRALVRGVQRALAKAGFMRLRDSYVDRGFADGTQCYVSLKLGGVTKTVYCSNRFPKAIMDLSRHMYGDILKAHGQDIGNGCWTEAPFPYRKGRPLGRIPGYSGYSGDTILNRKKE